MARRAAHNAHASCLCILYAAWVSSLIFLIPEVTGLCVFGWFAWGSFWLERIWYALWGNCKFRLEHAEGTKAMTSMKYQAPLPLENLKVNGKRLKGTKAKTRGNGGQGFCGLCIVPGLMYQQQIHCLSNFLSDFLFLTRYFPPFTIILQHRVTQHSLSI